MGLPQLQGSRIVIIGAGPAGLTAALEAERRGAGVLVLEKGRSVGGLSRTEIYQGYRFDMGGHRFFTDMEEIRRLWREMLGEDLLTVTRDSRIWFKGRFIRYPLEPAEVLAGLGPLECLRILWSYGAYRVRAARQGEDLESWMKRRFGPRLYRTFFKEYTEKVWGLPCRGIRSDWAFHRIGGLSLSRALMTALFGTVGDKSLISRFHYPRGGPGMVWERFRASVEKGGGRVMTGAEVVRLERKGVRIVSAQVKGPEGFFRVDGDHFLSTMPLADLMDRMDPPPDKEVVLAAGDLRYRDLILAGLVVDRAQLFPYQWIYVHDPSLRVGRIQNFKNWSPDMVPDPRMTTLGMEYFCSEGDDLWSLRDHEILALAGGELGRMGLAREGSVTDGVIYRLRKAYPIYDQDYRNNLSVIRLFLSSVENLQTMGRNGLHRYNNQDHSMLTGLLAVRNLAGEHHDLWEGSLESA